MAIQTYSTALDLTGIRPTSRFSVLISITVDNRSKYRGLVYFFIRSCRQKKSIQQHFSEYKTLATAVSCSYNISSQWEFSICHYSFTSYRTLRRRSSDVSL